MSRYILTWSGSGAGCLKRAQIGDRVIGLGYDLVPGPAPYTTAPLDFFLERNRLWPPEEDEWEGDSTGPKTRSNLEQLVSTARSYGTIEFWIDPILNAQLAFVQLLDWFRSKPNLLEKLFIVFLDRYLGSQEPEEITSFRPNFVRPDEALLNIASQAWFSFRQTTPKCWFELLKLDLSPIPGLLEAVHCMLCELPDARSGLMQTQRLILEIIAHGADTPLKLMSDTRWRNDDNPYAVSPYGYWQRGLIFTGLAYCPRPAIVGLNGEKFSEELHDDRNRRKAFFESQIVLTDFGRRLVEGKDDFTQHNPIDRWWGGTRLTNHNLWRWDPAKQVLVAPPSSSGEKDD